jgi:hypothetical protein
VQASNAEAAKGAVSVFAQILVTIVRTVDLCVRHAREPSLLPEVRERGPRLYRH